MIALVLGGAGSGKSVLAEQLAASLGAPVTYLAPTVADPTDAAMARRIAAHRARRPVTWTTVETGPALVEAMTKARGNLLVDSLTAWVAAAPDFAVDAAALCRGLARRAGSAVVVSDEVGLGVHPSTSAGLAFREALAAVNAAVSEVADRAWLVVAGRALALGPAGNLA